MLKKTITFEDFNGNKVTEDFYFNLSKAEITEMQVSKEGGLEEYLRKIIEANNGAQIMALFKELICKSVGRRSEDGRRFIKSQEIVDDFVQSNAYSELFVELATDANAGAAFVNGVLPSDLVAQMTEMREKNQATEDVPLPESDEPAWLREGREPNAQELREATQEQLRVAYQRKLSAKPSE